MIHARPIHPSGAILLGSYQTLCGYAEHSGNEITDDRCRLTCPECIKKAPAEFLDRFNTAVAPYMKAMALFMEGRRLMDEVCLQFADDKFDDQSEQWDRASGDVECDVCELEYRRHPTDPRDKILHVLCDGRRVKL